MIRAGEASLSDGTSNPADSALIICAATRKPGRVILFTRIHGIVGLPIERLQRRAHLLSKSGPLGDADARIISMLAADAGGQADFIGDLDPYDLACFIHARDLLRAHAVELDHFGIGCNWIDLCCQTSAGRDHAPGCCDLPTIQMNATELKLLKKIEKLESSVLDHLGACARQILESGQKSELEGASNPALYGDRFAERLYKLITTPRVRKLK